MFVFEQQSLGSQQGCSLPSYIKIHRSFHHTALWPTGCVGVDGGVIILIAQNSEWADFWLVKDTVQKKKKIETLLISPKPSW